MPQPHSDPARSAAGDLLVGLVGALPEIAEHVPAQERALAERLLVARLLVVEKGPWRPAATATEPGYFGLLVLEGLLTRDVVMHEPLVAELVGRGDLLRPGDSDGEDAPIPFDVTWNVADSLRLAVLDANFVRRAVRWPSVLEFVLKGMSSRAHALAVNTAISRLRHIDLRLLVLLWYLADRWGRVRPDGVCIPFELTHETLGRLVGSRRPSVTTALRGLTESGHLSRSPERFWILHGDPPETQQWISGPRGGPVNATGRSGASTVDGHVTGDTLAPQGTPG